MLSAKVVNPVVDTQKSQNETGRSSIYVSYPMHQHMNHRSTIVILREG
jgi:ABC-type sugar transport system ATPase subunit